MKFQVFLLITSVKVLFISLYHSTDFEVHRNWLAITHNLTLSEWYYEDTSEWTLDYPPFFAWLEFGLSYIAKLFDPKMLYLDNLNYKSSETILFQRLSVNFLDIVYGYGAWVCSSLVCDGKLLMFVLLVTNPGLLMVDHIHFQYNGFMYGLLLLSIAHMIKSQYIRAAFWFAVLLNFKHIYLYIAPVYIVYMLRAYCFTVPSKDGIHTAWYSFSPMNLIKLATTCIAVFAMAFGPFWQHIPQIISRLFPFKRGLCHAYWAPNFWALYSLTDKLLVFMLSKIGINVIKPEAAMTGGLVQEFKYAVLPTIHPTISFALTLLSMLPALVKMWNLCADKGFRGVNFVRCIVVCATSAFMFGWHVHEKAIIMIIIPMRMDEITPGISLDTAVSFGYVHATPKAFGVDHSTVALNGLLRFLAVLGEVDGRLYMYISMIGHYSLFPLLFPKNLLYIKLFMFLTHCSIILSYVPDLYNKSGKRAKRGLLRMPMLGIGESLFLYSLMLLYAYENFIHPALKLDKTLPFLPLMMTSVYCSIGVLYFYISYYYYFITFNLSKIQTPTPFDARDLIKRPWYMLY